MLQNHAPYFSTPLLINALWVSFSWNGPPHLVTTEVLSALACQSVSTRTSIRGNTRFQWQLCAVRAQAQAASCHAHSAHDTLTWTVRGEALLIVQKIGLRTWNIWAAELLNPFCQVTKISVSRPWICIWLHDIQYIYIEVRLYIVCAFPLYVLGDSWEWNGGERI